MSVKTYEGSEAIARGRGAIRELISVAIKILAHEFALRTLRLAPSDPPLKNPDSNDFHADVLRFDTSSLKWAKGFDPCPAPRSHHVAFYVEGDRGPGSGAIWVAGGHDADRVLPSVFSFDPTAQRWSEVTPRLKGRPELLARMASAATAATAPHGKGCVVVHGGVAPAASAASGAAAGTSGSDGTDADAAGAAAANAGAAHAAAKAAPAADSWLSDLVLVDPKRMLVERIEASATEGVAGSGGVGDSAGEAANGNASASPVAPSLSPYLPPPRAYHSLTSVSGRLVVFGGRLRDNSLAKGKDLVSLSFLFSLPVEL